MTTLVKRNNKPRLIQGVILKCVDGRWLDADGLEPPRELLVIGTCRALQCWGAEHDLLDTIIEQPNEPLPDPEVLNSQIPEEEWGLGLDNNPRPPWQLNHVVYLIDAATASIFTYLNSTIGARIAYERLKDRIDWMRALRGTNVTPIVRLENRPMKTHHPGGKKLRPEFAVIEWRELSARPTLLQIAHRPEAVNKIEALQARLETASIEDREGFRDGIVEETLEAPTKKKTKATVGKPVKPVSVAEEIDDGLPGDLAPPVNPLKAG